MIREIAREIETALRGRGVPFSVVLGPEPTGTTTWGRERIVLEHDFSADDSFTPVRGAGGNERKNPTPIIVVQQAFKATIYAQATRAGAALFEHHRRAEIARDQVIVAIRDVAAARRNGWALRSGRWTRPADLADSQRDAGAMYELSFTFERGVREETWAGAWKPEATIEPGTIRSTTKVSISGMDDDNDPMTIPAGAETACG